LNICWIIKTIFKVIFADRSSLVAENLALRQQLAVLQRNTQRLRIRSSDHIFWAWLSRLWNGWRSTLLIVQPETVVKWHRQGFKLYWRFKSRKRSGRPKISREIRTLIQRMSQENPTWGVPRIKSELALLGYQVAESTVLKYMHRQKKPPSQTWKTFLLNHADQIAAIDFFTMPSVTYRIFYVFVVLRHSDRKILHFNVTQNPSAIWTAQQITEAFPFDTTPRFILRDRDRIYGEYFRKRIKHMLVTMAIAVIGGLLYSLLLTLLFLPATYGLVRFRHREDQGNGRPGCRSRKLHLCISMRESGHCRYLQYMHTTRLEQCFIQYTDSFPPAQSTSRNISQSALSRVIKQPEHTCGAGR